MRRALAVGFGFAVASAAVMFACGGDDSNTGGGAGTTSNGTAGSGSGTAGSGSGTAGSGTGTAGSATGAGGSLSGAGGAIDFLDGGFDFDALFGSYTCAQLTTCCASLPAMAQADCNMIAAGGDMTTCSAAESGYKLANFCK